MSAGARSKRPTTERLLFPLAAAYGALSIPLSLMGMDGHSSPPGLAFPAGHAHELFFGYALAVVAGFLINRLSARGLVMLAVLWLSARISFLWWPGSLLSLALNTGFALAVATVAAPRFMKAAKKWRNRIIGPLLLAICTAAIVLQLALTAESTVAAWVVIRMAVLMFALLMLFFGGRLIAPAAAGAIEQAGGHLEARVQPRIEGALIILLAAAMPASALPALDPLRGVLLLTAATLAVVRLGRWRLWACPGRADLYCLGVGYAWLGIGLGMMGLAALQWAGPGENAAVHAITVGALGTLTSIIMLRTRLLLLKVSVQTFWPASLLLTALMSAAAILRLAAPQDTLAPSVAASCWSLALLMLTGLLLFIPGQSRRQA
ncbi:NnrS family protein [Wenzhouxiangella sp. AB-CW3]|uniref:NnrS family protein n=1 Tax=Wenzhouxiangella sp. AB-CW3 TaxID=2771012 RepID=UPI00168A4A7A|nr:NnrS family protein [Wenzhouxiangella sp. AB-CW3]QOC22485.1 NnrS family protein [Wenzhouxiangella sp. AB-CW3]